MTESGGGGGLSGTAADDREGEEIQTDDGFTFKQKILPDGTVS